MTIKIEFYAKTKILWIGIDRSMLLLTEGEEIVRRVRFTIKRMTKYIFPMPFLSSRVHRDCSKLNLNMNGENAINDPPADRKNWPETFRWR